MIECFDHHVFEFVTQKLLDGALIARFDLGIIGQHTDSLEITCGALRTGGKEFLHRLRGVGAVVQDLRECFLPRVRCGKCISQRLALCGCLLPLEMEVRQTRACVLHRLLQNARLVVYLFPAHLSEVEAFGLVSR